MCGGWQLQRGRTLTLAQAREQHHPSVRKFQRIVMGHGAVHVDLPEACQSLPDFLVWEDAAEHRIAFDILVEREFGAPTAAKPRVMELLNLVVTSLSSIRAGRLAT